MVIDAVLSYLLPAFDRVNKEGKAGTVFVYVSADCARRLHASNTAGAVRPKEPVVLDRDITLHATR